MASANGNMIRTNARIGSTILGVVLGTGTLLYAQAITPPSEVSKLLILVAPALAVVGDKISDFSISRLIAIYDKFVARQAHDEIEHYLNNPNTSDAHKDNLRRKMEDLETQSIDITQEKLLNPRPDRDRMDTNNSRKPTGRKRLTA